MISHVLLGEPKGKKGVKSQNILQSSSRVMIEDTESTSKDLDPSNMITLDRISQMVERISDGRSLEICVHDDKPPVELTVGSHEELLEIASIFNKTASRIEGNWQDLLLEDFDLYKEVYSNLKILVDRCSSRDVFPKSQEYEVAAFQDALKRLLQALEDALEFECISSEISEILSTPLTADEIAEAEASISKLASRTDKEVHSPKEIWKNFDAIRSRIASNAGLQK